MSYLLREKKITRDERTLTNLCSAPGYYFRKLFTFIVRPKFHGYRSDLLKFTAPGTGHIYGRPLLIDQARS